MTLFTNSCAEPNKDIPFLIESLHKYLAEFFVVSPSQEIPKALADGNSAPLNSQLVWIEIGKGSPWKTNTPMRKDGVSASDLAKLDWPWTESPKQRAEILSQGITRIYSQYQAQADAASDTLQKEKDHPTIPPAMGHNILSLQSNFDTLNHFVMNDYNSNFREKTVALVRYLTEHGTETPLGNLAASPKDYKDVGIIGSQLSSLTKGLK